jgi:3-methyladenine DNA glycosylase/8-oxoguanine DNA glycosylase
MIFELKATQPFSLVSVIQSHGWAKLAPFQTSEDSKYLSYILQLKNGQVIPINISENQNGVSIALSETVSQFGNAEIESAVTWMLALEDDFGDFYQLIRKEPKLSQVKENAQGRLLRSPTLFEDMVKTILTTNTTWTGTIRMTRMLVEQFGKSVTGNPIERAFPSPGSLASSDEQTLRDQTRLGYRAPYILELARQVDSGTLDLEELKISELPSEEVFNKLFSIRGIGNYAAANLLMLLGHYDYIPIDSWAIRLVSNEFFGGNPIQSNQVIEVFESWGEWKGLAYWLWNWSE